jgi:cytoskeletal protein CcmA (bactofilin family)
MVNGGPQGRSGGRHSFSKIEEDSMAGFRDRVAQLSRDQAKQESTTPPSGDAPTAARDTSRPIMPTKPDYAGAIAGITGQTSTPGQPSAGGNPLPEDNRLIVGRNIHLKGEIGSCDTLVVEGRVEASMKSRIIQTAESGVFIGEAEVDTAEIRGRFEGSLTANKRLVVHSTGRVVGTVRYGSIIIEEGGRIGGDIEEIGGEKREGRRPSDVAQAAS